MRTEQEIKDKMAELCKKGRTEFPDSTQYEQTIAIVQTLEWVLGLENATVLSGDNIFIFDDELSKIRY